MKLKNWKVIGEINSISEDSNMAEIPANMTKNQTVIRILLYYLCRIDSKSCGGKPESYTLRSGSVLSSMDFAFNFSKEVKL